MSFLASHQSRPPGLDESLYLGCMGWKTTWQNFVTNWNDWCGMKGWEMFPISHYGPEMKVMMSAISFGFEIIHSGAKENPSAGQRLQGQSVILLPMSQPCLGRSCSRRLGPDNSICVSRNNDNVWMSRYNVIVTRPCLLCHEYWIISQDTCNFCHRA